MLAYGQPVPETFSFPKKLKQLYTAAGAVRDLQLQEERISAAIKSMQPKPLVYLRLLRAEIIKMQEELPDLLSAHPIIAAKKYTDTLLPAKFTLSAYQTCIRHKWNAIATIILSADFSDDNIHFIRKSLKDLYYNLEVYEGIEHEKLFVSTWKGMSKESIEPLLTRLGKFQDQCTAIALLKSHWLSSFPAAVQGPLGNLKSEWIREKVRYKKELVSQLKLLPATRT